MRRIGTSNWFIGTDRTPYVENANMVKSSADIFAAGFTDFPSLPAGNTVTFRRNGWNNFDGNTANKNLHVTQIRVWETMNLLQVAGTERTSDTSADNLNFSLLTKNFSTRMFTRGKNPPNDGSSGNLVDQSCAVI